jgi:hypothetical protein
MKKKEELEKTDVVVQFSSCITKDNFHAPPCPHVEYLKTLVERIGIDFRADTVVSETSERRRQEGRYQQ